jgi:hypothetical protein
MKDDMTLSSLPQHPCVTLGPQTSLFHNSKIPNSTYHPQVLAQNCISCWHNPFSFSTLQYLKTSFPPQLIFRWLNVLSASVDEYTQHNYRAGLLCFAQFCDCYNIPKSQQMPASEALLCLFIFPEGTGRVTESTVTSWLSGLEMWHSINGASWNGNHILTHTKKGIAKLTPPKCQCPPRDPVSFDHMIALWKGLNLSNTHDAAI